jgi:hypothetical protein
MRDRLWLQITCSTLFLMLFNIILYLVVGKEICCMANCIFNIVIYVIMISILYARLTRIELLKIYESNRIKDK